MSRVRTPWIVFILDLILVFSGTLGTAAPNNPPSQFTHPLNFSLTENLGKALPPKFDYEFYSDLNLRIGDKHIATRSFRLVYSKAGVDDGIKFYWPPQFLPEGQLTIRSMAGKQLLRLDISQEDVQVEKSASGQAVSTWQSGKIDHYDMQRIAKVPGIRFCLFRSGSRYRIYYCSERLLLKDVKGSYKFVSAPVHTHTRFLINGIRVTSKGIVSYNAVNTPLVFDSTLPNGSRYHIQSWPAKVDVIDVVRDDQHHIIVRGRGGPPTGSSVTMESDEIWRATVDENKPQLEVYGAGDIPFDQEFIFFSQLPLDSERPLLEKHAKFTTYSQNVKIHGLAPKGYKVRSKDSQIQGSPDTGEFDWTLSDLKQGEQNRRHMELLDGEKDFTAYHEIYRGFPYELSTRITGLRSNTGSLLYYGEVAGSAWFENVFRSNNYWLSDRRWGVSANYFQNLGATDESFKMQVANAELKYRLNPGIWMKDPTYGITLGYRNFNFAGLRADMLGAGVLWGRPMPEFIDEIFDVIPWLRHPKWVDVEFLYFPTVITPSVRSSGSNFRLAFHGKMNFTPHWFIEGGFGMYSAYYDVNSSDGTQSVRMGLGFGTFGVGVNF